MKRRFKMTNPAGSWANVMALSGDVVAGYIMQSIVPRLFWSDASDATPWFPPPVRVRVVLEVELPGYTKAGALVAQLKRAEEAIAAALPSWRAKFDTSGPIAAMFVGRDK